VKKEIDKPKTKHQKRIRDYEFEFINDNEIDTLKQFGEKHGINYRSLRTIANKHKWWDKRKAKKAEREKKAQKIVDNEAIKEIVSHKEWTIKAARDMMKKTYDAYMDGEIDPESKVFFDSNKTIRLEEGDSTESIDLNLLKQLDTDEIRRFIAKTKEDIAGDGGEGTGEQGSS
jgi:hypothetical protein